MRTSPRVAFGLFALTIKQDITPTCSDVQPFSKVLDLKTGNVTNRPYITYEPNFWLLDGGYKFKPVNNTIVHVGLMSLSMSDASGLFDTPPVLTITFSVVQSTDSLALRFAQYSNDFANSIEISYYDDFDSLIQTDAYTPAAWEFSTEQAVADFKRITITFNSTNKPFRYLRLTGVDFGNLTYFTSADIKYASVVQEVNPLSTSIPIDTLELSLFSTDETFSIINPTGIYSELQNKQPMDVYEERGSEVIYLGQFYLDTWENVSNNEIKFNAISRVGVLESLIYLGGLWTTPITIEDLLLSIMTEINTPYELDTELYGEEILGWIPVTTYREALQQIAFAVGGYVTCARAGVLQINKTILATDLTSHEYTITKAEKGQSQSLTLKPLVTGVEITAHSYVAEYDGFELYNGTLPVGLHTITFSAPMSDLYINLSSTGTASIVSSGANYAVLDVTVEGVIVLGGSGYNDTKQVYGVYNTELDPSIPKNILSITDATLVNPANVETITQRVYDYYQQRYLQKVKLYAPTAEPGKSVLIDTLHNRQISGIVEKMSLDLTGGFLSQTEIVGVVNT